MVTSLEDPPPTLLKSSDSADTEESGERSGEITDRGSMASLSSMENIVITMNVKHTLEVIDTLRTSTEPEQLQAGLLRMQELVDDEECLKCLQEHSGHRLIQDHLGKFMSFPIIQQAGLLVLLRVIEMGDKSTHLLQDVDFIRLVLEIMEHHTPDADIQCKAIQVISLMALNETTRKSLLKEDEHGRNALSNIFVSMSAFKEDVHLQTKACKALTNLLKHEPTKQEEVVKGKEYRLIIDALQQCPGDRELIVAASSFISLLATQDVLRTSLVEDQVHHVSLELFKANVNNEGLASSCTTMVTAFTTNVKVQDYLVDARYPSLLLSVLCQYSWIASLQAEGLRTLVNMPARILTVDDGEESDWLKQVYAAMSLHREDVQIQENSCLALACLVEYQPYLLEKIGEDWEQNQDPLHTLCLGTLLMHKKNRRVVKAALSAIYWISADNDRIQSLLMDKNSYIAVLEGMKCHRHRAELQEEGCRAIRGLCIFSPDNKSVVADSGALSDLIVALSNFPGHAGVQQQALAAIACLADVELVKHQCIVEQIHLKVLQAMQNHCSNGLLLEVALEALTALAGAEGAQEVLNSAEILDRVIDAMRLMEDNFAIQKKGLVLIQILFDESHTCTGREDICRDAAQVIIDAMNKYHDALGIQSEGCVAMQVLGEKGDLVSRILVEKHAHECLFHILETYEELPGLHDLASECLFVLSCVRNLKSQMLRTACAKGMMRGVECLVQLGADVNTGQGLDTPLCYAVRQQDEIMVKFLLEQGISDLQTPLRLALELASHNVIGMILKHLGHDSEGGIVSWSNLNLGGIRSEWLYPTMVGVTYSARLSDKGKYLASRVRSTEERRQRRYTASTGSLDLTTIGRLPMRYSFIARRPHVGVYPDVFETSQEKSSVSPLVSTKSKKNGKSLKSLTAQLFKRTHDAGLSEDAPEAQQGALGDERCTVTRDAGMRISPGSPKKVRKISSGVKGKESGAVAIRRESVPSAGQSRKESVVGASALSPPDKDEAGFILWPEELEEWKRTTITGSNVPFSPLDPRRAKDRRDYLKPQTFPGAWLRKSMGRPVITKSTFLGDSLEENYSSIRSTYTQRHPRTYSLPLNTSFPSLDSYPYERPVSVPPHSVFLPQSQEDEAYETLGGATTEHEDSMSTDSSSVLEGSTGSISSPIRYNPRKYTGGGIKRASTLGCLPHDGPVTHKIRLLDLSSNNISDLSMLMAGSQGYHATFDLLEKLDLSHNSLSEFSEDLLKFLPNIQHLDLRHNKLCHFPVMALACSKLEILDISNNQIIEVSGQPCCTSFSLKELDISYNCLGCFPDWISTCMPGLETLSVAGNKIKKLPAEPLILKRLKTLNISYNYIRILPSTLITECMGLHTFLAHCNELENLPSEKVASKLIRLHTVKLAYNALADKEPFYIPKFLLALPSLRCVDLSNNSLSGLPSPLAWKTQSLRELTASHNNIQKLSLGPNAKLWANLERLILSDNKLTEIPKEIGCLTSLTSLDISKNTGISTLPDEMGRLSKLWEFPLDGVKLDLDEAILKGRTKDLIGYLHEKLKHAVEHYRMKLMVVGFGDRGKSTLLRQLRRVRQPEKSIATVGILVNDWKFSAWRKGAKYVTYTLSTWDFAGQEEFYSTHQCFLSNRSLYLVVYNLSLGPEEAEMLRPWLLNIQARAPGCPVIVVGTHKDLVLREHLDSHVKEMRERIMTMCSKPGFPEIKAMLEVDCTRENSGIDRLRSVISYTIDDFKVKGQPVMGQKIPASYVKLEELIAEEARNHRATFPVIRRRRLLKIVSDAGLDLDEDELQQAVRFLHESGVMLHYEDATLQLNDLYFIDPEWLCRMMAQVVTVKEINPFINEGGILRKEDMGMLFTGKVGEEVMYTFPNSLVPQYLKLLEKFEIALPQNEEELLVPCRLPTAKPHINLPKLPKESCIHRQYAMPYLPLGLWSRLITRMVVFAKSMLMEMENDCERPALLQYWREGIYVIWTEQSFFLLESLRRNNREIVDILVPGTRQGGMLMGQVVDHLDALIEEWYPGMTQKDPMGDDIIERLVPCMICPEQPHQFLLEDLINQSELEEEVICPAHGGPVSLLQLAPDVILGDIEAKFQLDHDQLVLVQSPEHLLGDGSFGSVYRAKYKDQAVAVKVYNTVGDVHPHKMLRQEVTILRHLKHPSLISMLGVGTQPRVVVLELASMGSLGSMLKAGRALGRGLQHRIALQVIEGLMYLHQHMIIYRDLKPDNVLLFNLSMGVQINAKISDYGISRFATPLGLSSSEGTPGYRAPEVARGEPYTFQADIYSFGIALYELVTGGKHPFDDLEFRSELDEAVVKGRPIDPITKKCCSPWPDMQDLIDRCLSMVPEKRPMAGEVYDYMCNPEVISLKGTIPVSKSLTVECMTVRRFGENQVEVWIGSGDKDFAQLSWMRLTDDEWEAEPMHGSAAGQAAVKMDAAAMCHSLQGMVFQDSRILCMTTVGQGSVLIGSQSGRIWVYDAWKYSCKHSLEKLQDSVLCLQHCQQNSRDSVVIAGLANGMLAVYSHKLITDSETTSQIIQLGKDPIMCMCVQSNNRVYTSCGSKVFLLKVQDSRVDVIKSFHTIPIEEISRKSSVITHLSLGRRMYICKKGSSIIELWDIHRRKKRNQINIESILRARCNLSCVSDARVTSFCLQSNNAIWVGTGGGHLVVLEANTHKPLKVIHRHKATVRAIAWTKIHVESKASSVVLTGGYGFCQKPMTNRHSDNDYGYLALWEGDFPQQVRSLRDYMTRREDLVNIKYTDSESQE